MNRLGSGQILRLQIVKQSDSDKLLVIGAGITLHEALAAAEELEKKVRLHYREDRVRRSSHCYILCSPVVVTFSRFHDFASSDFLKRLLFFSRRGRTSACSTSSQ